jgi:hypothetical protein
VLVSLIVLLFTSFLARFKYVSFIAVSSVLLANIFLSCVVLICYSVLKYIIVSSRMCLRESYSLLQMVLVDPGPIPGATNFFLSEAHIYLCGQTEIFREPLEHSRLQKIQESAKISRLTYLCDESLGEPEPQLRGRSQTTFLQNMSREYRIPLSIISSS